MRIVIAEERSNGLIGGDGDRVNSRGMEESMYAGGCSVFVGVIIMVDNVSGILVKRGKMRVSRERPWLHSFPSSLYCFEHLLLLQQIPSHCNPLLLLKVIKYIYKYQSLNIKIESLPYFLYN